MSTARTGNVPWAAVNSIPAPEIAARLRLAKARPPGKYACPVHGGSDSLHAYPDEGRGFYCFGECGRKYSNVDMAAAVWRVPPDEAYRRLAEELGISIASTGSAPPLRERGARTSPPSTNGTPKCSGGRWRSVPEDAPDPPFQHPDYGTPSQTWAYRNGDGQLLFYVCRFDLANDDKDIRPYSFDGTCWRWRSISTPRPLYNLHQLEARPSAPVIVCEGEKAADAAARLLPDSVATTSSHGAKSVNQADWSPLAGREVWIWPDHDADGQAYAAAVTKQAANVGARSISTIEPAAFGRGEPLPKGWDAADAEDAGWSTSDVEDRMRAGAEERGRSTSSVASVSAGTEQEIPWPDPLAEEAFSGIAGEVVHTILPHSEADPAALLLTLLAALGNLIGGTPHVLVGGDRHTARIFPVLVGPTGKGRKGSSLGFILYLLERVEEEWRKRHVVEGLSSGEGLINAVRDPISKMVNRKEEIVEPGVADKRLFVTEGEFGRVLRVMQRDGNTLSAVIRSAFDHGNLGSLTKNSMRATGAHISILGHITKEELLRYLTATEAANGFGNRFLWACVRRSKALPFGGELPVQSLDELAGRIATVVAHARTVPCVTWGEDARPVWEEIYPDLSEGRPGLVGNMTSRAEALTLRLALIYALLDYSSAIREEDLRAALAVWDYCEASARHIFGKASGVPLTEEIFRALSSAHQGLNRTEINGRFSGHRSSGEIEKALWKLEEQGRAHVQRVPTRGRPREIWFAGPAEEAEEAEKGAAG